MAETDKSRPTSRVDYMVDENATRLELNDNAQVAQATDAEPTLASTGPTNWWRTGLIALAIVAALLLILQVAGGWPGTDVQPGTPVADPQTAPADAG